MRLSVHQVVAYRDDFSEYPRSSPYHPSERYPEYDFPETAESPNQAYASVRECFRLAGLDSAHFGTSEWNPLGELMRPGETVVLKPNMVKERHPRDPEGWQYVLTHGSVIRAVADYIWRAIGPNGKLSLADAPQTDSSWNGLVQVMGLDSIREFYRRHGLNLQLVDLRREEWTNVGDVIVARKKLPGDPNGAVVLNLGNASEFVGHHGAGHYYGADYDSGEVNRHHSGGRHEYLIAGTVMKADVIFSLPKLKTHKKAGITVSLKNLVGVNADKNWLPHHTEGDPRFGGDEHPNPGPKHRLERRAASMLRRMALRFPRMGPHLLQYARQVGASVFGDTESVIRSGNWFGNDTIWRMCLDLNKLVLYGGADGKLREPLPQNRKRHYVLVDGLIAGEGSGPLNPDPVPAGTLIFGSNPPSVDAACTWLMGFDPEKIPIVRQGFQVRQYPLVDHDWRDVELISNVDAWNQRLIDVPEDSTFHFAPHFGWKGQIERQAEVVAR